MQFSCTTFAPRIYKSRSDSVKVFYLRASKRANEPLYNYASIISRYSNFSCSGFVSCKPGGSRDDDELCLRIAAVVTKRLRRSQVECYRAGLTSFHEFTTPYLRFQLSRSGDVCEWLLPGLNNIPSSMSFDTKRKQLVIDTIYYNRCVSRVSPRVFILIFDETNE